MDRRTRPSPGLLTCLAALLLAAGCTGGAAADPVWYYHFVCNGDPECLSTNFAGAPSGTSSQGPGQAGVSGCNGLLHFGNQFWNIPPAQQWCDHSPGLSPPPTPSVTVTLSPSTIDAGQSATLSWSSTLMSSCTASGAWSGAQGTSGSQVVTPASPGTYRYALACTGASGPASGLATLTVTVPPPQVNLAVSPATVTAGQPATLTWTSWQYTSCSAGGAWSGDRSLTGSEVVVPSAAGTYTYALGCLSATKGARSATATLRVLPAAGPPPPPAPTITLTSVDANFTCVDAGWQVTLSWSSTGATACTASGAWDGPVATGGSQAVFPGAASATSNTILEYALSCSGPGGTASAVTTVCVVPPSNPTPPPRPVVTLVAAPASISLGQSTTLSWTSSYASSCTASDGWSGLRSLSGQLEVTPPSAGIFTYALSCQGYQGLGSAQAILSVQVAAGTAPLAARYCFPQGLAVDGQGDLYVADAGNSTVRRITSAGATSTVAGLAPYAAYADGLGAGSRFSGPTGLAIGAAGQVYVADFGNDAIREISPGGAVTTLAGRPGNLGNGLPTDGTGAGASFYRPQGVAVAVGGDVYVADYGLGAIRRVTPEGVVTTLAGQWGQTGTTDATGAAARFLGPSGLVFGPGGDLFVADTGNHTIRRVTLAGVVTTFAGTAGVPGAVDGTGTAATFNHPTALAVDSHGNLFVTDKDGKRIRRITPAGEVSTFAGSGAHSAIDGTGTAASFYYPLGIAVDGEDNLYVTDGATNAIRKITPGAEVTTYAGWWATCGAGN